MPLGEPWSWKLAVSKLSRSELDREAHAARGPTFVVSPTAEPKQNGVVGPDPGSLHSFASRITGDAGWHSPEFIMSCVCRWTPLRTNNNTKKIRLRRSMQ